MKKKTLFHSIVLGSILLTMSASTIGAAIHFNKNIKSVNAVNLPTNLNLNDCTDDEIKTYYSSLSSKSESELSGTNLLKNLKGIINNNVTYYSYDQVQNAYLITERDWDNSPASELSGYHSSTNTVTSYSYSGDKTNNPYIRMLYFNYSLDKDKTHYSGDGDVRTKETDTSFDREHAWSQSHGFDNGTSQGSDLTGAGTDLHHLKASTQYGNQTLHNNYSYGFVKSIDTDWSSKKYETLNKRGQPVVSHSSDQGNRVFEPQDSDKGDIARALLYMVACYNNYDGSTPTPENPALKLVNYVVTNSGYSSVNLENGYYGILQDILCWHHMDPVDDFEIHRNNLIYRNYQHNRNPFIDYPQWVDYIWGTAEFDAENETISYDSTPTGHVDLKEDIINYTGDEKPIVKIEVTSMPKKTEYKVGETFDKTGMVVTATYDDDSTAVVTKKCSYSVDMSSAGEKEVTISYRGKTTSIKINVSEAPKPTIQWWVFVIGGVVLVVVIIGIAAGVVKINKKEKLR